MKKTLPKLSLAIWLSIAFHLCLIILWATYEGFIYVKPQDKSSDIIEAHLEEPIDQRNSNLISDLNGDNALASMEAPSAPTAEEWAFASKYTLKNSKAYRHSFGQQVRSLMPLSNPVRTDNLPITWPPQHLKTELTLKIGNVWHRWWRQKSLLWLTWIFSKIIASTVSNPNSPAGKYFQEVGMNTDHLKVDDYLRTVLDVCEVQSKELEGLLLQLHTEGKLNYGIHYSNRALMTCFVKSLEKHIHFVDGADGGYTLASRILKTVSG